MSIINSFLPLRNSRSAAAFYFRSPFRDNLFLGSSFILLADVFIAAVILVKDWNHMPARTVFYVALVLFGLASFWGWALKSHKEARLLLASTQIDDSLDETSPVARALSVSANMTYLALFYAFLLVGICLMALGEVL